MRLAFTFGMPIIMLLLVYKRLFVLLVTLKYEVFGRDSVNVDMSDANTSRAVREPMNLRKV